VSKGLEELSALTVELISARSSLGPEGHKLVVELIKRLDYIRLGFLDDIAMYTAKIDMLEDKLETLSQNKLES
jgi:hypothetical protein|tara:strand:- start:3522 stop:3740 length:219 start_codon:yes stop_codon:yes gene_type:complete